jgi:hypothetical protein
MPTRFYWEPPDDLSPSRYDLSIVGATETLLATVPHTIPGPYWQPTTRRFTFEDPQGTDATIYRVRALGPAGEVYGDTGPFQPSAAVAARLATRKRVDHDYGATNALTYQTRSGVGVPDATIRVFRAGDWDAGRRVVGLYVTETDSQGRWKSPLWVEQGLDYVIVYEKPSAFGPDVIRVTV